MDDKMIQNASKMIEERLTGDGDGNGAPVIWLHGNARREMEKLRRHADISLSAHSVPSLVECGGIDSVETAVVYLLFAKRTKSFLVKIDEIARMSLREELDLALRMRPTGSWSFSSISWRRRWRPTRTPQLRYSGSARESRSGTTVACGSF